jgi:hypothetical protein
VQHEAVGHLVSVLGHSDAPLQESVALAMGAPFRSDRSDRSDVGAGNIATAGAGPVETLRRLGVHKAALHMLTVNEPQVIKFACMIIVNMCISGV